MNWWLGQITKAFNDNLKDYLKWLRQPIDIMKRATKTTSA